MSNHIITLTSDNSSLIELGNRDELLNKGSIFGYKESKVGRLSNLHVVPFSTYTLLTNFSKDSDISVLLEYSYVLVRKTDKDKLTLIGFLFLFNPVDGIRKIIQAIRVLKEIGFTVYNEKQYSDLAVYIRNKKVGVGKVFKLTDYHQRKSFLQVWK